MLDFGNSMTVKVCVSFENSVYPISHVCKFINESNVSGWTVTFVGEDFTNATIIVTVIFRGMKCFSTAQTKWKN